MQKHLIKLALCALVLLTQTGCHRSTGQVWEDSKTCGRYLKKGVRSLFGEHMDAEDYDAWCKRQQENGFLEMSDESGYQEIGFEEFESSSAPTQENVSSELALSIDAFCSPEGALSLVFQNLSFETDNYSIKGSENYETLTRIAKYLHNHPNTFVYIEGHADERGAAAYNLALGSKRANAVRTFLMKNGVNADQLCTISYGKERPLINEFNEGAWSKNRRAQFKIHEE